MEGKTTGRESTPQHLLKALRENPSFQRITAKEDAGSPEPFLPKWGKIGDRPGDGYVRAQLPEGPYTKWISRLTESGGFKKSVENAIIDSTRTEEFSDMLTIEIVWGELGPKFDVAPIKSCNTHPRLEGGFPSYDSHNIDRMAEAELLATCLLAYLLKLYPAIEALESDPTMFSDSAPGNGFSTIELEGMRKLRETMPRY